MSGTGGTCAEIAPSSMKPIPFGGSGGQPPARHRCWDGDGALAAPSRAPWAPPASANSAPSRALTSPGGRLPAARVHGCSVSGRFLESGAKKSTLLLCLLLVEWVFKCWDGRQEALCFPLKPLRTHLAPVEALLCRGGSWAWSCGVLGGSVVPDLGAGAALRPGVRARC